MKNMNFSDALYEIKSGFRLARKGWNATGQWITIQVPDEHSKMKRPYIYIHPVDGLLVPWLASQTDLLSEDWFVV
jgi:hypothetical protein